MIADLARNLRGLGVVETISPQDRMFNPVNGLPRYLSVGRSGLRLILTAVVARLGYPGGDSPISTILDFGSAYGRVTRFLRAAFPEAQLTVTDLNRDAVDWCVANLGVSALEGDIPSNAFDLIFLGSVFTHVPPEVTAGLLTKLTSALRPNGILIFTTQGRYACADIETHPERASYGLSRAQLDIILAGYKALGYGFAEYSPGRGYGVSLIGRAWFDKQVGQQPDLTQILFQEKGYDHHQDGYTYLKSPILAGGRSGL